jgi:hypothetical protein
MSAQGHIVAHFESHLLGVLPNFYVSCSNYFFKSSPDKPTKSVHVTVGPLSIRELNRVAAVCKALRVKHNFVLDIEVVPTLEGVA